MATPTSHRGLVGSQAATFQADVTLSQGYHRVRLEYYEAAGWASVQLSWAALP
jgi:hypothetical protein